MDKETARKLVDKLRERDWGGEVITIDGVRVNYPDSWFLVRPSGTENLLRVTIEASNVEKFSKLRESVIKNIKELLGSMRQ